MKILLSWFPHNLGVSLIPVSETPRKFFCLGHGSFPRLRVSLVRGHQLAHDENVMPEIITNGLRFLLEGPFVAPGNQGLSVAVSGGRRPGV